MNLIKWKCCTCETKLKPNFTCSCGWSRIILPAGSRVFSATLGMNFLRFPYPLPGPQADPGDAISKQRNADSIALITTISGGYMWWFLGLGLVYDIFMVFFFCLNDFICTTREQCRCHTYCSSLPYALSLQCLTACCCFYQEFKRQRHIKKKKRS